MFTSNFYLVSNFYISFFVGDLSVRVTLILNFALLFDITHIPSEVTFLILDQTYLIISFITWPSFFLLALILVMLSTFDVMIDDSIHLKTILSLFIFYKLHNAMRMPQQVTRWSEIRSVQVPIPTAPKLSTHALMGIHWLAIHLQCVNLAIGRWKSNRLVKVSMSFSCISVLYLLRIFGSSGL